MARRMMGASAFLTTKPSRFVAHAHAYHDFLYYTSDTCLVQWLLALYRIFLRDLYAGRLACHSGLRVVHSAMPTM